MKFTTQIMLMIAVSTSAALLSGTPLLANCSDFVLHLSDEGRQIKGADGRDLQIFVNCHEGNLQFPAATTIQSYEFNEQGQFCFRWRSCGNIKHWRLDTGTEVGIYWGNTIARIFDHTRIQTVGDALTLIDSEGTASTDDNRTGVHVRMGVGIGEVERHCSALSQPYCW